jgi:hypothetical protein
MHIVGRVRYLMALREKEVTRALENTKAECGGMLKIGEFCCGMSPMMRMGGLAFHPNC